MTEPTTPPAADDDGEPVDADAVDDGETEAPPVEADAPEDDAPPAPSPIPGIKTP